MPYAIDAEYTEIQGTASGVFLCGMRPLHAGCDGLVSVAFSMAEETGRLAHTKTQNNGRCKDCPLVWHSQCNIFNQAGRAGAAA